MTLRNRIDVAHEAHELHKEPVLDHGYVAFIESWGSDERIIEAARMSTGNSLSVATHECAQA